MRRGLADPLQVHRQAVQAQRNNKVSEWDPAAPEHKRKIDVRIAEITSTYGVP
jgi:hypothetical protein